MNYLAEVVDPVLQPIIGNIDNMPGGPAGSLSTVLVNLMSFFIGIGGLYFFVMLILGGYAFITAGADKDGVQKATAKIKNALIGIVILLSIYAIIWVVEALFGVPLRTITFPTLVP